MMNLLVSAVAVSAGSWAAYNTGSTGAFIQQPQYLNTASTGAFTQQPQYLNTMGSMGSTGAFVSQPYKSFNTGSTGAFMIQQPQYLNTASTGAFTQQPQYLNTMGSTGAFVSQPYKSFDTGSTGAFIQQPQYLNTASIGAFTQKPQYLNTMGSTGAFVSQPYRSMRSQPLQSFGGSYGYGAMESGSSTNPYNANMLNSQGIAPMSVQASKVMGPVKRIMAGEEHVVNNDLQMHVNHEADKTVTVKRIVHHSPVLHKTIRTHQIAQDVVHDKKIHHMNVVEDRVKQVPGQQFAGSQEAVDHTVAQPNIASTGAYVQQPMPLKYKSGFSKW